MAEQIDLTTPYNPGTEVDNFRVTALLLDWKGGKIVISLEGYDSGWTGTTRTFVYADTDGDPVATNLMIALNKADLSTNSLHKRIINQLISDGYLDGSISGTPD